jgi:hypothetical protein
MNGKVWTRPFLTSTTRQHLKIAFERVLRLEHFIERHNSYGQFVADDAEGKR